MAKVSNVVLNAPGVSILTTDQINRTIVVTGISNKATIQQVSEFFSYCGAVEKILQGNDGNENQYAYVVFEREGSYSMALLLRNAVVVDKPINVHKASAVLPKRKPIKRTKQSDQDELILSDRSASEVITSLISAGYVKGEAIVKQMKVGADQLDKKLAIRDNLHLAQEKAKIVNEQYGITDTLTGIGQLGMFAAKSGAESVKSTAITAGSRLSVTGNQVKEGVTQLTRASQAKLNEMGVEEKLKEASSTINQAASTSWSWVKDSFQTVRSAATQQINTLRGVDTEENEPFPVYESSDDEGGLGEDDLFARPEMDDIVDTPEEETNLLDEEETPEEPKDDAPKQTQQENLIEFGDDPAESSESTATQQQDLIQFD